MSSSTSSGGKKAVIVDTAAEMERKGAQDGGICDGIDGGGSFCGGDGGAASLAELVREVADEVMYGRAAPLPRRAVAALRQRGPRFRAAAAAATLDLTEWVRRGGTWRALLVTIVGIVVFVAVAALATFGLFFLTATVNAVALGFLMSLSGIGAFMAVFFMLLSAIYVGALVVAAVTISSIAIITIVTLLFATGWVAFLWIVWRGARKLFDLCRASLAVTATTLSALSASGSTTEYIAIEKN